MLTVRLANEHPAGLVECLLAGIRPFPLQDGLGKQVKVLRIPQQPVYPTLSRRLDKAVGVLHAVVVGEYGLDVLFRQRIQSDHCDGAVQRDVLQCFLVVGRHPIGPPAGQPEGRAAQAVQPLPNVVERRPAILCAGARLVEPIQKKRCIMPLRLVFEGPKVPDCDILTPLARLLSLECRCLAGARFGDQHVRRSVGVLGQWPRRLVPAPVRRPFFDHRTCPRGDIGRCFVHNAAPVPGFRHLRPRQLRLL